MGSRIQLTLRNQNLPGKAPIPAWAATGSPAWPPVLRTYGTLCVRASARDRPAD
jgi:hypothetical protein